MRAWQLRALAGLVLVMGFIPLRAAAQVVDVQIAPPTVQLRVGDSSQVFATAYGQGGNVVVGPEIRWNSNDTSVVRVNADPQAPDVATLVAVKSGAAVVEARVGTARGFVTVNVTGPAPVAAAPPAAVAPAPLALADSVLPIGTASAVLRSVARIDAQRSGGPSLCASGVLVGRGLVATSYQAIRGANRLTVTPEGGSVVTDVQVASYSVANDIAMLRVPVERADTVALARNLADNQYAWAVGYPGCQAGAAPLRLRITGWENRPAGSLRFSATLAEAEHGAPLIDQSGSLLGLVNGDRTAAAPFSKVQTALDDARSNVIAQRLRTPEDVGRIENHLYGSFTVRSDATGATARVTPLESWQWSGLAREGALPLTFTGPMGRYQVDLLVGGTSRASTMVLVTPGGTEPVALNLPAAPVAQAPATPARPTPTPAPAQPVAKKGGGGGAVVPLVILGLGGGGAAAYFLTKKKDTTSTGGGGGGGGGSTGSISVSVPNP
ncbi:MAG: trypsin-like peptidase domain-containing protein [Gemmatimonadetes bacterium]|nr:trypsin-like peptidase domain-containing protein [Gemmatimonadota bacterium]